MKTAKIVKTEIPVGRKYSLTTESGEVLAERIATSLNLRRHQPVKDELAAIAVAAGYTMEAN